MLAIAVLHLICLKQQDDLVKQVSDSGRCVTLAETPDSRVEQKSESLRGSHPF